MSGYDMLVPVILTVITASTPLLFATRPDLVV